MFCREVGSRRAHADVTWRGWTHNGVDQTWLLDTPTEAVDQEGHQWLLRMQEVPSKGLWASTTREPAN